MKISVRDFLVFVSLVIVSGACQGSNPLESVQLEETASQPTELNLKKLQKEVTDKLRKYGVFLPPRSEEHDHERGKGLISLAIRATSYLNGDWVLAHGLLGAILLECDVLDMLAYKSLFLSLVHGSKLYSSSLSDALLTEYKLEKHAVTPISRKSIIFRRESILAALAHNLESRYIYDEKGNFGRHYGSEDRKSNNVMLQNLETGLQFYNDLKQFGYVDKTLRDALGMAFASLRHDAHLMSSYSSLVVVPGPPLQIYSDALEATLNRLKAKPGHSHNFLEELALEMGIRGLADDDHILLPRDQRNFEAILKIIDKDLAEIQIKK